MDTLRVTLVGAGILGRRYARVLGELDEASLVAVVNRTADRGRALATAHGVSFFASLAEAADVVPCEAVVVATADHAHREPVVDALRRGLHVLVEKPLATELADARAMVSAATEAARVLKVNHSQREVEDYRWVRDRLRDGAIGTPALVHHLRHDRIDVPTQMIRSWSMHTSPLFFMSSHDLDLVAWMLEARPVRVAGQEHRGVLDSLGFDVHDAVDAFVTYDSGATAAFHTSWIHPREHPAIAADRFMIVGDRGSLVYDGRARRAELHGPAGEHVKEFTGAHTADEVEGRLAGAFVTSVQDFVRCVREGVEPATSGARMIPLAETQDAILRSIRDHRTIELAASPATVAHP